MVLVLDRALLSACGGPILLSLPLSGTKTIGKCGNYLIWSIGSITAGADHERFDSNPLPPSHLVGSQLSGLLDISGILEIKAIYWTIESKVVGGDDAYVSCASFLVVSVRPRC